MRLTQEIIRNLIKEELDSNLQEIDKNKLRTNSITTISNLLTKLESEQIDAIAVLRQAERAFEDTDDATQDLGEAHDHEDDMAKRQMYKTARDASQVFDMIRPGDNYPAWLQSKMTKVADYIGVIKNYLEYDHVMGEDLTKKQIKGRDDDAKSIMKSTKKQYGKEEGESAAYAIATNIQKEKAKKK